MFVTEFGVRMRWWRSVQSSKMFRMRLITSTHYFGWCFCFNILTGSVYNSVEGFIKLVLELDGDVKVLKLFVVPGS